MNKIIKYKLIFSLLASLTTLPMDHEPARRASLDEAVVSQTAFWKKIRKNIKKMARSEKKIKKKLDGYVPLRMNAICNDLI